MDRMSSWARSIAGMSTTERTAAAFGPYVVTPGGALQLPIEQLRQSGPGCWPIGEAPGWHTVSLPNEVTHRQWLPLDSEYFFQGQQPVTAHAPSGHPLANSITGGMEALKLVLRGDAFPFASRYFALPTDDTFIMNSFGYHVPDMEAFATFIGYRDHTKRYHEILTPGIYRAHNKPSKDKHDAWVNKSRIACNVLKQRFLEHEGKPLTDLEARGILQHYRSD